MTSHAASHPSRDSLVEDLNPAQREAVMHAGSPLLVVAGAGTGKTRVLTRRVAWLVAGGLPPWSVLAITFTNKAARVLRSRLGDLPRGEDVHAGTFHGFGAWLLRRYGDAIGIDKNFTILDREDQRRLLKALVGDLGYEDLKLRPAAISAWLGHAKNGGAGKGPADLRSPHLQEPLERLARAYHERLRASSLLDFDDLLLESLRLLVEGEGVAEELHRRFSHVLVDEYQDTNLVQRDLLMRLVGPRKKVTAVGDPDQSIYRWRGAAVSNILGFGEDFPGTHTVLLEQNYRSTANILDAVEPVIARNKGRHAKRLYTQAERGEKVMLLRSYDGREEARRITQLLTSWRDEGLAWSDMAIFYRVNSHSRALELALREAGLPYVVIAGVEFFQRREVKDVLAYARLVLNPKDEAAFLRAVGAPKRGVGDTSLKRLRRAALDKGVSLYEAALDGVPDIRGRAKTGLARFVALIEEWRSKRPASVRAQLESIVRDSGYEEELRGQEDDIERSRLENVQELVAYAGEFDRTDPEAGLEGFIERTSLVADQDAYEEDGGRVNLMSVHAAKGLEFDGVIVSGAELGYFPHSRSLEDDAGVEEERRLFYVAMTRARKKLALAFALQRVTWSGLEPRRPSPFLEDIPGGVLSFVDDDEMPGASYGGGSSLPGRSGYSGSHGGGGAGASYDDEPPSDTPVVRETGGALASGDRVKHPYFGTGTLESISGSGPDTRVTVDFDSRGRKQMQMRYAKLEKLS